MRPRVTMACPGWIRHRRANASVGGGSGALAGSFEITRQTRLSKTPQVRWRCCLLGISKSVVVVIEMAKMEIVPIASGADGRSRTERNGATRNLGVGGSNPSGRASTYLNDHILQPVAGSNAVMTNGCSI